MGPWSLTGQALHVRVRTDGSHGTWSPLGIEERSSGVDGTATSLRQLPDAMPCLCPAADLEAWRTAGTDVAEEMRELRKKVDAFGDAARLQALQAATLHMAAQ